jgi:hypothetical protein
MPIVEIDVPKPSVLPFSELPENMRSVLHRDLSRRMPEYSSQDLVLGHEVHMLALTAAYKTAGEDNLNILPMIRERSKNGWREISCIAMARVVEVTRDEEPVEAMLFAKSTRCTPHQYEFYRNALFDIANETLRKIGIPVIPGR